MKKLFVIPAEVVPTEEDLKTCGIRSIEVLNDVTKYVRPYMIIKHDPKNDRAGLKHKTKTTFVKKSDEWIKGRPAILKKLQELCTNIEQ